MRNPKMKTLGYNFPTANVTAIIRDLMRTDQTLNLTKNGDTRSVKTAEGLEVLAALKMRARWVIRADPDYVIAQA